MTAVKKETAVLAVEEGPAVEPWPEANERVGGNTRGIASCS